MSKKKHHRSCSTLVKSAKALLKFALTVSSILLMIIGLRGFIFPKFSSFLHKVTLLKERKRSRQLKFVNRYRKKHRLTSLKDYYELDKIAKSHSYYMARNRTCNHSGFHGRSDQVRRLTGSGYVAENCFRYPAKKYNKRIAKALVKGWMQSPGHRENLLNPRFRKIGIGVVTKKGWVYATQIFSE